MQNRKILLSVLLPFITTTFAFAQKEALKVVVNDLAYYKKYSDLKYLSAAKKSADSLVVSRKDSADLEKNIYRALANSSILYIDSANKLGQSPNLLPETAALVDKLTAHSKIYKFQPELDYAKRCLANTFIRRGFEFVNNSDFANGRQAFENARKYAPNFKPITDYIAYSNNKMGNLVDAAKYYSNLLAVDSTRAEYIETASNIYKSLGDTVKALQVLQKGRRLVPADRFLLLDEANIYNNIKDYKSLEPLIGSVLDMNANNADIAFVAASCYDHLNKYDKAEALYLQTIELNGSAYEPVFNLGLLYLKKSTIGQQQDEEIKNLGKAVQWLEKANELSPANVKGLQALQLVYTKTTNKEQLDKVNNKLKQLTN